MNVHPRRLIFAEREGELTSSDAQRLREHLDQCRDCAGLRRDAALADALIARPMMRLPLPPFERRDSSRSWRVRALTGVGRSAAVAIVVAAALAVSSSIIVWRAAMENAVATADPSMAPAAFPLSTAFWAPEHVQRALIEAHLTRGGFAIQAAPVPVATPTGFGEMGIDQIGVADHTVVAIWLYRFANPDAARAGIVQMMAPTATWPAPVSFVRASDGVVAISGAAPARTRAFDALTKISRSEALDIVAGQLGVNGVRRIDAREMAASDVRVAVHLASGVADSTPVIVVAAAGELSRSVGSRARWFVDVRDAGTGASLAQVIGVTTWPAFFDALPDHPSSAAFDAPPDGFARMRGFVRDYARMVEAGAMPNDGISGSALLANATVTILPYDLQTRSDSRGEFWLPSLPVNSVCRWVSVRVQLPGYGEYTAQDVPFYRGSTMATYAWLRHTDVVEVVGPPVSAQQQGRTYCAQ